MCRLKTAQLEVVLKDYPLYSQENREEEALCRAIFALGSIRWYILEGQTDFKPTPLGRLQDKRLQRFLSGMGF